MKKPFRPPGISISGVDPRGFDDALLNQRQRRVTADAPCPANALRRRCGAFKRLKVNAQYRQRLTQLMELVASLQRLSRLLSQIFTNFVITCGVAALRSVDDQHDKQRRVFLCRRKAMQKISGLVEAWHDQNMVPVTFDFWRAAGKDRVSGKVLGYQTLRPTNSVKRGPDGQRLHTG